MLLYASWLPKGPVYPFTHSSLESDLPLEYRLRVQFVTDPGRGRSHGEEVQSSACGLEYRAEDTQLATYSVPKNAGKWPGLSSGWRQFFWGVAAQVTDRS